MPNPARLEQQIAFLLEVDKVKHILRRNLITDASRVENDAEHMWHVTLMAVTLVEWLDTPGLDLLHVVKMLLIHDLVEIDAGDTFAYDAIGYLDKIERETRAADRIFGLLPEDQATEFRVLWEEFEARTTPEARYANALDRLSPMLLNLRSGCGAYRQHGITPDRMRDRNRAIVLDSCSPLWAFIETMIGDAAARGLFDAVKQADGV